MSAAIPRKALIAISSYHGVIYPDGTKTGLFFTEALHPFEVLTQAGFDIDLASETGTYGLDDLSLTDRFLAGDDKAVFVLWFRRSCCSLRLSDGLRPSSSCRKHLAAKRNRGSCLPRTGAATGGDRR